MRTRAARDRRRPNEGRGPHRSQPRRGGRPTAGKADRRRHGTPRGIVEVSPRPRLDLSHLRRAAGRVGGVSRVAGEPPPPNGVLQHSMDGHGDVLDALRRQTRWLHRQRERAFRPVSASVAQSRFSFVASSLTSSTSPTWGRTWERRSRRYLSIVDGRIVARIARATRRRTPPPFAVTAPRSRRGGARRAARCTQLARRAWCGSRNAIDVCGVRSQNPDPRRRCTNARPSSPPSRASLASLLRSVAGRDPRGRCPSGCPPASCTRWTETRSLR